VLRARHHGTPADAACALLVPVGAVSAQTARRAAREPDLPAAARFFAARRLPDAGTAAALLHAQRRYEIDGDLARVEETVACSARARQATVLAAAGPEAEQVTTAIRREADDLNLLLALRLRTAGADGSGTGDRETYLPGGSLTLPVLRAIQRAPARQDAVAAVPGPARQAWRGALADWSQSGDLASIIGIAALGENDRRYLSFADDFEQRFIGQGGGRRGVEETLDLAWELLGRFPRHELTRIRQRHLDRHYSPAAETPAGEPDAPHPG
jgi:hypothetical protein